MEMRQTDTSTRSRGWLAGLIGAGLVAVVALAAAGGVGAADPGRPWEGRHGPGGPGRPGACMGVVRAASEVDATLAELTDEGTLTVEQADAVRDRLRQRAEQADGPCAHFLSMVDQVSALLGLGPNDIHERFMAGQSLAEIAEEQGVARDDLVTLFQDAIGAHLDEAVADGKISGQERDALQVLAFSRIESMIDHHMGDGFGPGHHADPAATPAAGASA